MPVNTDDIRLKAFTTLTISSGAVTGVQELHTIAAETGTTDDLDTITLNFPDLAAAGETFRPNIKIKADTGDTITLKHGTGNLYIPGNDDVILTENNLAEFLYDGTNWRLINAVGQATTFTITNWVENLSLDCNAATNDQLADMMGTVIKLLSEAGIAKGTISA